VIGTTVGLLFVLIPACGGITNTRPPVGRFALLIPTQAADGAVPMTRHP
jgi:hypothetical protein